MNYLKKIQEMLKIFGLVRREDSIKFFEYFLKFKFNLFGDYEDAVDQRDNILFHSALSPFINVGLITPAEILSKLKELQVKVNINSYEVM